MQEQWPNDGIAMSALHYLTGSIGRGNPALIDFETRSSKSRGAIYDKSVLRPALVFDYPVHILRPDLSDLWPE